MNRIAEECILCDFRIYPDFFLKTLTKRIGSYIKVVLRLQANPKLGGHSEKSCKPGRCIVQAGLKACSFLLMRSLRVCHSSSSVIY